MANTNKNLLHAQSKSRTKVKERSGDVRDQARERARAHDMNEFYTQLSDIEYELQHYKKHFKGKVIYCNCDDPLESNFFIYFVKNFRDLGLKKLITTCYDGSPVAEPQLLFSFAEPQVDLKRVAYKIEVTDVEDFSRTGGKLNFHDVADALRNGTEEARLEKLEGDKRPLKNKKDGKMYLYGGGDFRSRECIELLKESDIVVTNPPFSLFDEYFTQLVEYKKKFLIIGPLNAISHKAVYPLIEKNKVWLGWGFRNDNADFATPHAGDYGGGVLLPNGLVRFRNCHWFTNMENNKRNQPLELTEKYTPEKYPKYDNYDAIRVEKVENIPCDYDGVIGVPISFLSKLCPTQFEFVKFRKGNDGKDLSVNGKIPFFQILIRKKRSKKKRR